MQGKCCFLASSEELRRALELPMQELRIHFSESERWLGVDYEPAVACRKRTPAAKRNSVTESQLCTWTDHKVLSLLSPPIIRRCRTVVEETAEVRS